jgi:hypothetical protein
MPGNKENNWVGLNITYAEKYPDVLKNKYAEIAEQKIVDILRNKYSPLLTILNNGHSLSEPDAPKEINIIQSASEKALALLEDGNISSDLRDKLVFFLSCLHKDMPPGAAKYLMDLAANIEGDPLKKLRYAKNIAYAIGDASLDWQKNLLNMVLNNTQMIRINTSLYILAIACWRDKDLVFTLDIEKIHRLIESLKREFENNIYMLAKKKKGYLADALCKNMELLLAILRVRRSENKILKPREEMTDWFVEQLDKIQPLMDNSGLQIRSFIEFDIKKRKEDEKIPDLIYALKLYLTGHDLANTIIINSADFGNDDSM